VGNYGVFEIQYVYKRCAGPGVQESTPAGVKTFPAGSGARPGVDIFDLNRTWSRSDF